MKFFYVILTLLYFCNSSWASVRLVVASDTWCPYICDDQQLPGYIVEIVRDIFHQNNISLRFETLPLARAIQFVANNQTDMVLGLTEEQIIEYKLSKSQLSVGRPTLDYFVINGNPWRYTSNTELIKHLGEDKKIGVIKGYSYSDFLNNLIESRPEYFYVSHGNAPLDTNLNLLNAGRIDILIDNKYTVLFSARSSPRSSPQPELRKNLVHAGTGGESEGIFVGFAPHLSTDYINMLDQGIIEYRKSGKLKVLLDKYDITDWQKD
jgi:polar amino acid transport system substrate-binding protein